MRICHVIPSLDPAHGGPPIIAERLGAAQAALGADVGMLFCERAEAAQRVQGSLDETPGGDRLALHPVTPGGRLDRLTGRSAGRRAAQLLAEGMDFMHFHGIWMPMLAATAQQCVATGTPYCICTHGMLDHWSLAQKRLKKQVALRLQWKRVLNGAAFIHCGNQYEADLMAPLGIAAPVEIIPNGIFIEEFEDLPAPGTFRAGRPELGDDPYVLFLSRLHHKKGLDLLAPAFARALEAVPQARLVVAGPDDGARAPFERQTQQLGIAGRVHVIGPIYGDEKLAALRDAACFCLPSRQEGFSIAITEALACCKACVVTTDCHYPEVGEGAGRLTNLDPAVIGAALAEVLSDPALADRMGAAGGALVRERFTWPRIAEQTLKAYERARERRT